VPFGTEMGIPSIVKRTVSVVVFGMVLFIHPLS
jgi:hypothetical protein